MTTIATLWKDKVISTKQTRLPLLFYRNNKLNKWTEECKGLFVYTYSRAIATTKEKLYEYKVNRVCLRDTLP